MLVYGDVECSETVGIKQETIKSYLTEAGRLSPGIERHSALVTAFICASELVQALVDMDFERRGFDTRSALHSRGIESLSVLARYVARSWRTGFRAEAPPASVVEELFGFDPSPVIRTKRAEGYAFYALYPESYLEAAWKSGLGPKTRVIGIRSIGAGLGALVAAALGAPPPFSIRPVGHPFRREARVDPALTEELTADPDAAFAIVDEGPGLSGSSFGAVADWLEAAGVRQDRIHFFPSHAGPLGPQASPCHRERWETARRHTVGLDRVLFQPGSPHRLPDWIEDVTGPLIAPLEDISGGGWRGKHYMGEGSWPAANVQHERLKYIARTREAAWLVKFAGLGETGLLKYERARLLHEVGFTPEPVGYRHGFLVERWHDDASPLDQAVFDRERLVERVGAYLGFRARRFPVGNDEGASLGELRRMACHNARQALGEDAAEALERALPRTEGLERVVGRVATDNRMHHWEWLVLGNRLLKTDSLDHSATHDLIGCQDIGWDITGAIVELELSDDETADLCRIVQREGSRPVHRELLTFLRPCYLAFQMGSHAMAAEALGDGREAERLRQAAARYGALLRDEWS